MFRIVKFLTGIILFFALLIGLFLGGLRLVDKFNQELQEIFPKQTTEVRNLFNDNTTITFVQLNETGLDC